jgi:hypothetical protein
MHLAEEMGYKNAGKEQHPRNAYKRQNEVESFHIPRDVGRFYGTKIDEDAEAEAEEQ